MLVILWTVSIRAIQAYLVLNRGRGPLVNIDIELSRYILRCVVAAAQATISCQAPANPKAQAFHPVDEQYKAIPPTEPWARSIW